MKLFEALATGRPRGVSRNAVLRGALSDQLDDSAVFAERSKLSPVPTAKVAAWNLRYVRVESEAHSAPNHGDQFVLHIYKLVPKRAVQPFGKLRQFPGSYH